MFPIKTVRNIQITSVVGHILMENIKLYLGAVNVQLSKDG